MSIFSSRDKTKVFIALLKLTQRLDQLISVLRIPLFPKVLKDFQKKVYKGTDVI